MRMKKTISLMLAALALSASTVALADSPSVILNGEKLYENYATLLDAIVKAKPAAAKGQYIRSCVVTSTMGVGIKINPNKVLSSAE